MARIIVNFKIKKMKSLNYRTLLFTVFFLSATTSCKKIDRIVDEMTQLREQTVLALNDGINALENQSSDWQFVLKDLERNIDKRINDILTYNIPYIVNLASQRALSTVLCVKENVKDEVIYYLQVAIAELTTGVKPPLPATKICLTSLLTIDLNAPRSIRNQVVFTGYYIHTKDSIKAYLEDVTGGRTQIISKSRIGFPDISNITVSLADYSDDVLSTYTHLELYYNEEVISSIAIDKKLAAPPIIETVYTNAESLINIPPHTNGDRDFGGNGPIMVSHLYLKKEATRVLAQVYLKAKETRHDWTTAEGYSGWKVIYIAPSGYQIKSIIDPVTYKHIIRINGADYVDNSVLDFTRDFDIGRVTLVGDTNGPEAGSKTKIVISKLKRFKIQIQKL